MKLIAEYTINHYTDDILQDIYKKKPDVIAFSCYIWNLEYVKILMEDLAKNSAGYQDLGRGAGSFF